MNINNKEIELDQEGYLINPEDWNIDIALEIAKTENISISDEYWGIFNFMRSYYNQNGVAPDVRHVTKQMALELGVDKKTAKTKLFTLFPYGYVKQTCKIAGMKRPRGWSTG